MNDEKTYSLSDFSYENLQIGDYVDQDVVDEQVNMLPPACMRSFCTQMGEPYSHRQDPETGKWRATYATFKKIRENVWEFCGHCFRGENVERGIEPVYC